MLSVNRLTCLINGIIETLDSKQKCAALFVDLSKAFDTVDFLVLLKRFTVIGLSAKAVGWFENYLSSSTQCAHSDKLIASSGVPQGCILGPLLFKI